MANQPTGPPVSYRTVPNRNVTKRWKEAHAVDYEGGWGDEDYDEPVPPAQEARDPGWGPWMAHPNAAGGFYPQSRAGNPSPMRGAGGPSYDQGPSRPSFDQGRERPSFEQSRGRPSFDHGDERRMFSSNPGGFEGPYPTAQRSPFPEPRHGFEPEHDPQFRGPRGPPPLHIQTGARPHSNERGPYSAAAGWHGPDRRMNQYSEPWGPGPYSAGPAPGGQRSQSSGRPPPGEILARHESPVRPGSRGSQGSSPARIPHPPRKSSLSQQNPPPEMVNMSAAPQPEPTVPHPATQAADAKPLPFLRPIDIWNRHKEESERQSQASSRPSLDSSVSRDPPVSTHSKDDQPVDVDEHADSGAQKPALDPVVERKSEQGLENQVLQEDNPEQPSTQFTVTSATPLPSEPPSATSDYSNYVDRSNASIYSSPSFREPKPDLQQTTIAEQPKTFSGPLLPNVNRVSSFGNDFFDRARSSPRDTAAPQSKAETVSSKAEPTSSEKTVTGPDSSQSKIGRSDSQGYRSLVEQAFDESEREPPTPFSTSNTVNRSDSASTSEISPIFSRTGALHSIQETLAAPPIEPTIHEEPDSGTSPQYQEDMTAPNEQSQLPIKPGFRQEQNPPGRANSPARGPPVVSTSDATAPESAILLSTSAMPGSSQTEDASATEQPPQPRITTEPQQMDPSTESKVSSLGLSAGSAEPESKSASDEYREWQAQRQKFNAKMGIQDTPSVGSPSPISRSESPTKGTVRDLAEKLESQSGRSSPHSIDLGRPANARLESFRPVLPGGWQSYTTNASTPRETPRETPPPVKPAVTRMETSDSQIPRAGPPQREDHPSTTAFAAAAVAGSALAGAFSAMSPSKHGDDQENLSEVSYGDSHTSTSQVASEAGQSMASVQDSPTTPKAEPPSPRPPSPLPKDTPQLEGAAERTDDYFPAPLRTSKSGESKTPNRSFQPGSVGETSPDVEDNDRLQQEIVQSLTPRSSVNDQLLAAASEPFDEPLSEGRSLANQSDAPNKEEHQTISTKAVHQADAAPRPGLLDQRFSWETDEEPAAAQPTSVSHGEPSSQVSRDPDSGIPLPKQFQAPDPAEPQLTSQSSRPATSIDPSGVATQSTTSSATAPPGIESVTQPPAAPPKESSPISTVRDGPTDQITPTPNTYTAGSRTDTLNNSTPPSSAVTKEIPLRRIMEMDRPEDKWRAFASNRQHFAGSDRGLEQWIQAMGKQSAASAAILARNGALSAQQNEKLQNYKHSPSKNVLGRLTSDNFRSDSGSTGTKLLQEDSKRLVAAAGKNVAKAGSRAKGFLAKSKDKLRTASAGDKANKRRSSGPMPIAEETPPHSSHLVSASAPQIPEQSLNISPVDQGSWNLDFGAANITRGASKGAALSKAGISPSAARDLSGGLNAAVPSDVSRTTSVGLANTGNAAPTSESGPATVGTGSSLDPLTRDRSVSEVSREPSRTTEQAGRFGTHMQTTLLPVDKNLNPSQKETLGLSHARRSSNVSAVSSPSQGPDWSEEVNRSISPALVQNLQQNEPSDAAPAYAQLPSKAEEASTETAAAQTSDRQQNNLPIYQNEKLDTPTANQQLVASSVDPDGDIGPVTDQSASPRTMERPPPSRPFSFAASNSLEPESRARVAKAVEEPNESSLAKEMSKISVEDLPEEKASPSRASKSYSRPFASLDPNLHEHPALRSSQENTGRVQPDMRKESPLPSARRPPEELDRYRQFSPGTQPAEEEEGYRIPGPYGQEYRSPKQPPQGLASWQSPITASQQQQQPPHFGHFNAMSGKSQGSTYQETQPVPSSYQGHPASAQPPPSQPPVAMGPPVLPEKARHRKLGGLFRTRSKSRSRGEDNDKEEGERKRSSLLFKPRSRHDSASITTQPSQQSEAQDQVPDMTNSARFAANTGGDRRRQRSKNLFRSSTSSATSVLEEEKTKKKRHSGLGGLFSRKSKDVAPPRSSTSQGFHRDEEVDGPDGKRSKLNLLQQQFFEQQLETKRRGGKDRSSSNPYSATQPQGQFSGSPPPPGGYYAPSASQWPQDLKQADGSYPGPGPIQAGSQLPPPPHHLYQGQGRAPYQQQAKDVSNAESPGYEGVYDQRPNNLRIDTRPGVRDPNQYQADGDYYGTLAAEFARHRQAQDLTYTQNTGGYGYGHGQGTSTPQPQPPPTEQIFYPTTRAPTNDSASSRPHAIDLHKRSRSPRNGRRPSFDEDHERDRLRASDPVSQLGTFKNRSPVGRSAGGAEGEEEQQEKPWNILLPDDGADEAERERQRAKRKTKQVMIERAGLVGAQSSPSTARSPAALTASPTSPSQQQMNRDQNQPAPTVAEKLMGPQVPLARPASGGTATRLPLWPKPENVVAELPGSKAEGYESEEEIPMSATAYPGQEWMPMVAPEMGYGKWDD